MSPELASKIERLDGILRSLGRVVVAFSGGVDSTALAHACGRVLGSENVRLVTAQSGSLPRAELEEARRLAHSLGLALEVIRTREIERPEYVRNDAERCYFCKQELFEHLVRLAAARGFDHVVYGEMADDRGDHRPGARAASEQAVVAPLAQADLGKDELREYLRSHSVTVWDKPSFACLASRIERGLPVSSEVLARIERCEDVLRRLGFRQFRVRHHGSLARIELDPAEIARATSPGDRGVICREFRAAGYAFVTVDLDGYRTGSMNTAGSSALEGGEVAEGDG